ncbi:PirG [Mycobacterium parmense]|uniref:Exported repetitive protein n=1 Tax=Mycobacterium parmense TaxID=185642 RepID=A0A7I7YZR4_9MYCO|nr:PirG [Mycobacterium parmense]MCV7352798.1 PirG [Mycobacterium parmense]BBZ46807.1 Exported repetitive protein [Mycobacterium parmense]
MPNRRRRKLSTAMSAVAAVAVASPCAYFLVYESTSAGKQPEHHEFKQAAVMTDLPGELMGALTQGLSQFGINMPPIPALSGGGASTTGLTGPGLGTPGLGTTGLTSPGLTSPGLTSPGLTSPGLASPGLSPTTPGLTAPGALPTTPGVGGLTTPGAGLNPALTSPAGGLGTPAAGEVPITTPAALDPGADGTYPILGDPSTLGGGGGGGGNGGGGLINDVMQAANQLGAGQAIDLLKGLVMPAITQSMQGGAGAPGALPGAAGALPGALPGAAGALPGAAGALPHAAAALPGAAGALPGAAGALPGAAGAAAPAAAAPLPPV